MAVREVLRYPHPALKRVAAPLEPGDPRAGAVAADLVDTMRAHPGCVGLAAPQLGEPLRIAVVDLTAHPRAVDPHGLLVLVNPKLTRAEGAEVAREGCLSIPDLTANVKRATSVTVAARSPDGEALHVESAGFEARCLQHELDHLDGLLFLDRVHSLTADVFPRRQPGGQGSTPSRGATRRGPERAGP